MDEEEEMRKRLQIQIQPKDSGGLMDDDQCFD